MKTINLYDIDINSCEVILDKSGRVVDGINHGRKVLYDRDKNLYYKIFDKEYCRRKNFVTAYEKGFFDELAPALKSLIIDEVHGKWGGSDTIIGYVTEGGKLLSTSEFDSKTIPEGFLTLLKETIIDTNLFYYDFVPINIVKVDEKLSLIDLESVYHLDELYDLDKHNAIIKPPELKDFLMKLKDKVDSNRVISFIQPSRNNLKYLKWSYNSIRKNLGYRHEICWADDFSDDGTWEWMNEIKEKDVNVKIMRNEGPNRLGHTILYDTLVNNYATNDIVMIYHADMYACPKMDEMVLKHLKPGKVVSATRIEPPLHPEGAEKILEDFGIEPEEFKEQELLKKVTTLQLEHGTDYNFAKFTEGIFAPWAMYKDDFQRIGGHDPLYAPQSKEDSDIFNRFVLAGYELIQTWEGFVYHMTSRGSRFKDGAMRNPAGQVFMKGRESTEWLTQNLRSTRNFIRKWGHMVKHNEMMKPIIPPKYDVGFIVENCDENLLKELEPWCSNIHVTLNPEQIRNYIDKEQPDTQFNLTERILYHSQPITNNVTVRFDAKSLTPQNFQILVNLSEILQESGEMGEMELEIFKFNIKSLQSYEKELIKCVH